MKHRVLNKHKTRGAIHIQWSHEDTPMHPSFSSPQWLSGNMPAIILTLSSNVFNISKKNNEKFARFKNVPIFCAFGSVESAKSWICFLLLAECWFTLPRVETKESKNPSCVFEVQWNKDYCLSTIVSRDARLLCFK